jgi:hypothetical protein
MIDEEELIKKVEKAASKGARIGSRKGKLLNSLLSLAITVGLVIGGVAYIKFSINNTWQDFKEQFGFEDPAEKHDMVIENNGFLGYTAADFSDPILGDRTQLKKLEVYEAQISDAVTLTDTGLANLSMFTKTQVITYNGIATYTVDLSNLSKEDFSIDNEKKVITMKIPHCECGKINVPSEEMEFEDTEKGWLAFGDITMNPEQLAQIQTEATSRMEDKLDELNERDRADKFAKMTVWELYQPTVSGVCPEYKLEVEFVE